MGERITFIKRQCQKRGLYAYQATDLPAIEASDEFEVCPGTAGCAPYVMLRDAWLRFLAQRTFPHRG